MAQIEALRRFNASQSINKMPSEIMAQIFNYDDTFRIFQLSAVCYHWRSVAITNPSLWNRMTINPTCFRRYPNVKYLLALIFERSGAVPLNLELCPERDCISFDNRETKEIPDLFPKFVERAGCIRGLAASSFATASSRMPFLHTLQVWVSDGFPLEKHLNSAPKLRHLFINLFSKPIPQNSNMSKFLVTLHLDGISETPMAAMAALRFISQFPLLRELALSPYECGEEGSMEHRAAVGHCYTLPRLRFLALNHFNAPFQVEFLNHSRIHEETDVIIQPMWKENETLIERPCRPTDTSAIWVDFRSQMAIYKHARSLSCFQYRSQDDQRPGFSSRRTTNSNQTFSFSPSMCLNNVQFLSLSNLMARYIFDINAFSNLVHLIFSYVPASKGANLRPLSSILHPTLASFCPLLTLIGVRLTATNLNRNSKGKLAKEDEALLLKFLNGWIECTGERFPAVHVEDNIDASRWGGCIDALRERAGSFELGAIPIDQACPMIPAPIDPHKDLQ